MKLKQIVLGLSLISLLGCQIIESFRRDQNASQRTLDLEGALDIPIDTDSAVVTNPASLLNLERMKQTGFNLDWSLSLLGQERIRQFYLLGDSIILETQNNQLHSLDRYTGHYKWLIQLKHPLDFSPTLHESKIDNQRTIYCVAQNNVYAIDATRSFLGKELGVLRWKLPLDFTASTSAFGNEFFVALGVEEKDFVLAIQSNSNEEGKKYFPQGIAWKRALDGDIVATPAASTDSEDATLMVATENGVIHGLNFYTGERRWRFPKNYQSGKFKAPLVIHENQIYAANTDHTLYILDRNGSGLLGKIVLDSPLTTPPWVVGTMNIEKDDSGRKIINIDNDLNIFVQSSGNPKAPEGTFYHLKITDIVDRDVDVISNAGTEQVYRRWDVNVTWQLPGQWEFLFRTRSHFYLKQNNDIVVIRRSNGQIIKRIGLGPVPVSVHYDPTSNYDENRLFMATPTGGVYSLELQ